MLSKLRPSFKIRPKCPHQYLNTPNNSFNMKVDLLKLYFNLLLCPLWENILTHTHTQQRNLQFISLSLGQHHFGCNVKLIWYSGMSPSFGKSKGFAIPGFVIKYSTKWLPRRGRWFFYKWIQPVTRRYSAS